MARTIFILLVVLGFSAGERNCCPPGQKMTRMPPYNCIDPEKNSTTENFLKCDEGFFEGSAMFSEKTANLSVNERGQLLLVSLAAISQDQDPVIIDNYCLGTATITSKRTNKTQTLRVAVCCLDKQETIDDTDVTAYCFMMSSIFLLLTAAVYAALPELWDLQGKSIICACTSLGIGLAVFSYMRLHDLEASPLCAVRGFIAYFFIIGAFLWMNAISIQILLSLRRPSLGDYGWREFLRYCIYAWGLTTALTVLVVIVNYHPGAHLRPGIGLSTCWFTDKLQQWIYMYSVMAVVVLANIGIFVYASIVLWKTNFSSTNIQAMKYKFGLMLRLCTIMGLPWIFEMLSSFFEKHIFWSIMDIINTLQGPLIFLLIVVLRRRVLKALLRRGWLLCCGDWMERHLAKADDAEDIVEHTAVVNMEARLGNED